MGADLGRFARKMHRVFGIVIALLVTFLTAFVLVLLSTTLGAYGATFFVGNALIYYWIAYAIYSIMLIGGAFNAITKALTNYN